MISTEAMKTSISTSRYLNMELSMRTFLILALTFVATYGRKTEQTLLLESIESVKDVQNKSSEKILNLFVKDVFHKDRCSADVLCQAAKVLAHTPLKHSLLRRQLFEYAKYTGNHNCNVTASEQHKMRFFLTRIEKCCQKCLRDL